MIEETQYKDWSAKFHEDHAKDPIVMQMEVTYRCPIHCVHCYADCYNNAEETKKELSTEEIKKIIDKLHEVGCVWFTFTGGDPMARRDFIELYRYAKKKGFITSVMTSLVGLTDEILDVLTKEPPFSIDMTLNGATEETYEKISGVKGSFKRVVTNIDRVLSAGLPLKIKTLVSKNNVHEIDKITKFLEERGLAFSPSTSIFARLNGDASVCEYRLPVDEVIKMQFPDEDEECGMEPSGDSKGSTMEPNPNRFYRCAVGNWQWHINPYGQLNICSCVREPSYDLLNGDVREGIQQLSDYVKGRTFKTDSECRMCDVWHLCHSCPGKANLEMHDEEKPVMYYCELAKEQAKRTKPMNVKGESNE